jgi:hypothetical protein
MLRQQDIAQAGRHDGVLEEAAGVADPGGSGSLRVRMAMTASAMSLGPGSVMPRSCRAWATSA